MTGRLSGELLDAANNRGSAVKTVQLPLTNDRVAIARALWFGTNQGYGTALDNYLRVQTEAQVRARVEGKLTLPKSQEYLGKEVDNIDLGACDDCGRGLAFSPDSRSLFIGTDNQVVLRLQLLGAP